MRRRVSLLLVVLVVAIACAGPIGRETVGRLAFGWWSYLDRVAPRIKVGREGVATGFVCLVLFTIGLHAFLRWLHGEMGPSGRSWRVRWTAMLVSLVVLMFVVGLAAAGVAHQAGWLLTANRPLTSQRVDLWWYTPSSIDNLKYIGLGVHNYLSANDRLPSSVSEGKDLRSWQTKLLGMMPIIIPGDIHPDLPWNDPRNSAYFKGVVLPYLNADVVGAIRDRDGYALSHYAGNVHVLGAPRGLTLADFPEGSSHAIVAGEVASGFQPWGDPSNLRDPARGVNLSADGFGGPSGTGALMLYLDGSVKFLRRGPFLGPSGRIPIAPPAREKRDNPPAPRG